MNMDKLFICDICDEHFKRKFYLQRHIGTIHRKERFKCDTCGKQFTRIEKLLSHKKIHSSPLICDYCERSFSSKYSLKRHRRIHLDKSNSEEKNDRNILECAVCLRHFSAKFSLVRHIQNQHKLNSKNTDDRNIFECEMCHQHVTSKVKLLRHIRKHHELTYNQIECKECKLKFAFKRGLREHIENHHLTKEKKSLKRKAPRLKCLKCDEHFANRELLFEHYEISHDIKREFEYLCFNSIEDFEKWLNPCYSLCSTWTTSVDNCVLRYRCHRSGTYRDPYMEKNVERIRRLQRAGSKKLQGFCIAEVTLRQRHSDGVCAVTLQKRHVGHSIEDDDEVRHIYLTRTQKEWIAGQLLDGVPKDEILEKVSSHFDVNEIANRRLSTLSLKDIDNIAASWKIDAPLLRIRHRTRQCSEKKHRPKVTSKIELLHERHAAAEKYMNERSLMVHFDTNAHLWEVNFFTPSQDGEVEMYYIQKNKTMICAQSSEACVLPCLTCRSCSHEYSCSCCDSVMQNIMCKHIHALCLFFQNFSAQNKAAISFVNEVSDVTKESSADLPLAVEVHAGQRIQTLADGTGEISCLETIVKDSKQEFNEINNVPVVAEMPTGLPLTANVYTGEPTQILANGTSETSCIETVVKDIKRVFNEFVSKLTKNLTPENCQDWYIVKEHLLHEFESKFHLLEGDRQQRQKTE